MVGYRLCFTDNDGHILHAAEWECADDDAAMDIAAEQLDGRPVELWSGTRLIAKIPGADD
jgi:hypothetical protein